MIRDFDRARAQAKAADAARRRGTRGALLGLPMTLKESINVAGLRTTCGLAGGAEPDGTAANLFHRGHG